MDRGARRPRPARAPRDGGRRRAAARPGREPLPLEGEVEYVEALGRETFIGVRCGDAQLVVDAEGRVALPPGERVRFGLVAGGLRYFDPGSGAALRGGVSAAAAS